MNDFHANENQTPVAGSIGYIVGGSLKENLRARLTLPPEQVQEGSFVVIESDLWRFYGLATDLQLGATDPRFADEQSEVRLPASLAAHLHGQTLFTTLEILPALMLECGPDPASPEYAAWRLEHPEDDRPRPIKTIPRHHAAVRLATEGDVAEIFGQPGKGGNFAIGTTREQGHPVCLDLDRLILRSAGIFGATGTGKSFLARLLLAGLIRHNKASVLVFDMHNEYGFDDRASDTGQQVPGLRTKFPAMVRVVALGRGSMVREDQPDFQLEIAGSDIQPEDIEMLTRELNLKETTPATLDALVTKFGRADWYRQFKAMKVGSVLKDEESGKTTPAPDSVAAWANEAGVNVMAAEGLHNKLGRVFRLPYITDRPAADTLQEIIRLLEAGNHIVLSFANHETDLDYLLVTNLITRRIREAWEKKTNEARSREGGEPRQLVVVLEEAHKLLNREMSRQTAFSIIAREMRKYFVTLLVIDQRPSQIDDEVMSQLGTRISGWLGDDLDIQAVLSGLAGREALRGMLSRLQPKEEVLLLGWGMPMPLPVRSRRYDDRFWQELTGKPAARRSAQEFIDTIAPQ